MRWKSFRLGRWTVVFFGGKDELGFAHEWGVMLVHFGVWMLYASFGRWDVGVRWHTST